MSSSDSEHSTPKPSKRRRVVISDSEGSSDASIVKTHRRRRVYRVTSDSETSEDDSDILRPVNRRKNYRVVSEDDTNYESSDTEADGSEADLVTSDSASSDPESDWRSVGESSPASSAERRANLLKSLKKKSKARTQHENEAGGAGAGGTTDQNAPIDGDSDSSDAQGEKCPICLLSFKKQQIATPESCDHAFCLDCLLEWSKNINTCPVDRQTFAVMLVRKNLGGKVIKQLPVTIRPPVEEQIQEDATFCEICQECDREDRMLLCDGCDLGYHLECLTPPMTEVPMDEWFCPECSQNSQDDAETVPIDLDELPDLMEEARRLGESYGRTRTGREVRESSLGPRVIPRTRQTERVRANIRADRDRNRAVMLSNLSREASDSVIYIDPDQPSTSSSGMDSVILGPTSSTTTDTRDARSLEIERRRRGATRGRVSSTAAKAKPKSINKKKRKSGKRKSRKVTKSKSRNNGGETRLREVRITEINDDGEEEEFVTYVKVKTNDGTKRTGRRYKKKKSNSSRKKSGRKRRARTVRSQAAKVATVKKRLAIALGMHKLPRNSNPTLIPAVKNRPTVPERAALSSARYHAGISQVSLFGNPHDLNYSPTGSDTESDSCLYGGGHGTGLLVSSRPRNAISSTRHHTSLKTISNPLIERDQIPPIQSEVVGSTNASDFISSILNSQEFWHSKNKTELTLKADGTFFIQKNNNEENKHSLNNNASPIKEKKKNIIDEENNEARIDLNNVNQNDMVQNPMYNSPRGGGNRGNFRGGNNYNCENNRHSYGGGYGGGRDSYGGGGGRHSYGGPRDGYNSGGRDFGPPINYNQGFEARGFGANQQFRNRNPQQNFRNERPPRFPPPLLNDRQQQNFGHQDNFPRFRPQIHPLISPPRAIHNNLNQPFQEDVREQFQNINDPGISRNQNTHEEEDCDLYSDIEPPINKSNAEDSTLNDDSQVSLPPPPEPPSGLLDFEESKSDRDCNDSDQELVIDDTPKEETKDHKNDDKYDPFDNDSDSNEPAVQNPVASQSFTNPDRFDDIINKPGVRLTAYDDDEDDDSQADCPNFSIYSSQTMDVARNSEQELSQQIGPLEPPPLPPDIPDDDDIIVGDIQACDLSDIPEPSDPYVESLQKERQTLSKIPPKKISNDSRGKITFKIGNKLRLSNKLSNLYDEMDETIENSIQEEEEKKKKQKLKGGKNEEEKLTEEDEEEEKLEELEKELKEKEQKLREMERQEEMEKLNVEAPKEESEEIVLENVKQTEIKKDENNSQDKNKVLSMIDLTEKSSDTIISIADTVQSSPKNQPDDEPQLNDNISNDDSGKNKKTDDDKKIGESESAVLYDHIDEDFITRKVGDDIDDDKEKEEKEDSEPREEEDEEEEESTNNDTEKLDFIPEVENFPLEKEIFEQTGATISDDIQTQNWESDGGYTPCKDELPVTKGSKESLSPFESGLEPITPTKDKSNDDLDGCRTPAGYAGLGTEAISETDEPMSFEDELTQVNLRKEKEMEDGEIMDDGRTSRKTSSEKVSKEKEDDNKRKKKKDKKEKGKESDKNKENIASQNQVAWKKISKSTKERQYRDKDRRSKSKDREKEKDSKDSKDQKESRDRGDKDKDKSSKSKKSSGKEITRKKEKRKELERYDVRKIVADKPSRPRKDEYGRDIREESRSRSRSRSISRRRSLSRDRRSRSYSRNRSRTRSRSRLRRSWSRDRKSYSRRRSLSRSRRKVSRRRSASRKRSISRKRSLSKRRSRSLSRKRRSLSPRRRSRGRSISKNRRSRSRSREKKKEKIKKQHKSRSRSRNRKRSRSKTPPKRVSSRSRDKKHNKRKLHASRSRERSRERTRSREQRERNNKNWENVNEKVPIDRERRSWSAQWTPSWSRSRSRTPSPARHEDVGSHGGWSPPPVLDNVAVPPKNLTVILTNKEAIKKKKKEKKKDPKKLKEIEKRKKSKRNRTPPPSKEVFASGDNILVSVCFNKENETNETELPEAQETQPLVTPAVKRSRRRTESIQAIEPTTKRSKKERLKEKRVPKSPKNKKEKKKKSKAAEIAAGKKPVAVIDLDQSPFREQTPSPRDVIVLSDDEDLKQAQEIATPEQHVSSPRASPQCEQFVSQGPKTPPEPQIKFSINKQQSNLRTSMINPLHEEEEEEIDERADEELEMRAQEELELRLKIGPNTPPEPPTSPPTSPDAYDPFDPTKSRSPTPAASQEATPADERDRNQCSNSPRNHDQDDDANCGVQSGENEKQNLIQDQQNQGNEKREDKPKIISMVTIKRASPRRESPTNIGDGNQTENTQTVNDSPSKSQQVLQQNQQNQQGGFTNINPVLATVTAAVQRSGSLFNTSTPISGQRNLIQPNRISPINQNKTRVNERAPHLPNLFSTPAKTTPSRGVKSLASSSQNKNASTMGQNGSDATMETTNDTLDMSSPYSPGSSLSDGIFDPPSPGAHSPQQLTAQNTSKNTPSKTSAGGGGTGAGGGGGGKSSEKKDAFDVLFGTSPAVKNLGKNRQRKFADKDKRKKSTNPKVGVRMDENQLQILDDLPSSAVEMQVKDKFLKKLNRQERVVEEVKLVLKPHYTKKHVTKEEYKDIMRKAVPKICHNKTGEINPKKIGQLVEAYVKKCRINKKKGSGGGGGGGTSLNPAKGPKAPKNLWS